MFGHCCPVGECNHCTEKLEEVAAGHIRIKRTFGNRFFPRDQWLNLRLSPEEKALFSDMKVKGYIGGNLRTKRDYKLEILYDHWVEIAQKPMVRVNKKIRYATVSMDLIFMRYESLDKRKQDRKVWDSLAQDPPPEIGGYCRDWGNYISFEKIPKDNAEMCAKWILGLYEELSKKVGGNFS